MTSWDLSMRDRRWHAIDERAEHPAGAFRAECGQLLPRTTTTLHKRFSGTPCEACARKQLAAALRPPGPPVDVTLPSTTTNAGRPAGPRRELPHPFALGRRSVPPQPSARS